MPMYAIKCDSCQKLDSIFRKIAERDENLPSCCGQTVRRIIVAPAIHADIIPYKSPSGDYMVNSRAQRKEDLRRSAAIGWEPGIEQDIARNKAHQQEKAFAPLAKAVDETVAAMVAAGKLET